MNARDKQFYISRINVSDNSGFIYTLEDLALEILSNPIAEKAYSRITSQGVQVIIDYGYAPSASTLGEYKPGLNILIVYVQNNLSVQQATATIIHESVHVQRRTKIKTNTKYE